MLNAIPQHTGLVDFVTQVIFKRTAGLDTEKQTAITNAIQAMYDEGISVVGDICNGTDSIAAKKKCAVHFRNFIEVSGMVDAGAQKRFDAGAEVLREFEQALPLQTSSLTPHAPYSVGGRLFTLLNEAVAGVASIHNQECAAEDTLFITGGGDFINLYKALGIPENVVDATHKTSLKNWLPHFTHAQPLLCVHNTYSGFEDLQLLDELAAQGRNVFLCVCPGANLYIENMLPPNELFNLQHVKIVVGTDSLASNDRLSVLAELKILSSNFSLDLETLLRFATSNGAAALGVHQKFGSLQAGMQPGLLLIEETGMQRLAQTSFCHRIV